MFFAPGAVPFPDSLAAPLERALWPGDRASLLARRQEALRRLWPRLAKNRGQESGSGHYSFQREEADAYAAYYLPANCLKPALVLEEAFLLGCDPMPASESRWLDLGTGPGTAWWGLAWWCAKRGKKCSFTGWDQSPAFQKIAQGLTASRPFPLPATFLAGKEDPLALVKRIKPTHVSLMNSAAEIWPDPAARESALSALLKELAQLERADGQARFLLVVEPGSRDSSRELAALKDKLQAGGPRVLLPCLDDRACGALADARDWCHEEVACDFPHWLNELGSGAGLRKESVLFSYALLAASGKSSLGLEAGWRLVSQRMERKGQVECRLCTRSGKVPVRVQRSKATPENEFFLSSGRGEIWREAKVGEKTDLESAVRLPPPAASSVFFEA